MEQEFLMLLILISGIILAMYLYNFYQSQTYDKALNQIAKDSWNKKREIKRNFKTINFLIDNKEKVDSISWNDLEMDKFFSYFDRSFSILGRQALYKKLHELNYNQEEKNIRDEIINNKDKASKLGKLFLKYGRLDREDFFDLLKNGTDASKILPLKIPIYLLSIGPLLSIPIFFINKGFAIMFLFAIVLTNIFLNMKIEDLVAGKTKSFSYIRNLVSLREQILKSDLKMGGLIENLKKYEQVSKQIKSKMGKFYVKTGSESDMVYIILNSLFLFQARRLYKTTKLINEKINEINELYKSLAKIDMELGIAIAYEDLKDKCIVEFTDKYEFIGEKIHNPILYYRGNSVANSFDFKESILLTGSNASGKSTFLRTFGINLILAMSLGFAFGEKFTLPKKNIYSAIDIKDSIESGKSYFMAETSAIKRMIDNEDGIYILDEIFKGTNTIDRISAALFTLKYLSKRGFVIAATHDIELTRLAEGFKNYHFEENIKDGDIFFDYKLKEDYAKTRNAIEILKINDYPEEIVKAAKEFSLNLEKEKEKII